MIDENYVSLSIRQQCTLLKLNRSCLYYHPRPRSADTHIANEIHETWMKIPSYGYRRMTAELQHRGYNINHKRVLRLMGEMGLEAIYPKPKTSLCNAQHKKYPYLLKDLAISGPDHVWATDITYIKLDQGFAYLVALIDLYSRYIVSWNLSNTLDTRFCLEMIDEALLIGKPEILNTDQGCQFTSDAWTGRVLGAGIQVSMDGKGRWADNIFIERFWRTLKHEHVYLHTFDSLSQCRRSIGKFITFYNHVRLHQNLGYRTPGEIYSQSRTTKTGSNNLETLNELGKGTSLKMEQQQMLNLREESHLNF